MARILPLLFLVAGIGVIIALWLVLRPSPHTPGSAIDRTNPADSTTPAEAPATAPPKLLEWTVSGGRVVAQPGPVRVQQGDEVILRICSDAQDEMHLHGYELQLAIPPEDCSELPLVTAHSGRFELELHGSHLELGTLEVQPFTP